MKYLIWDVSPEIFQFGPIALRWYGLFFALGFIVGNFLLLQIYRNENRKEENLSALFLYIFAGALIGARLGHVLFYQPDYYLARPWEILMIWQGGLASHGGFAGLLIAVYLYLRKYRETSFLELSDRLAITAAPAAALIRLGNFFNSEIIGVPTDVPWAVVFVRVDTLPRHPAMLYEAVAYIFVFAIAYVSYWKTDLIKTPGRMLGLVLTVAFTARFFIELVKENQVPFEQSLLLNMGQLLSLPFILIGLLLFSGAHRRKRAAR